MSTQLNELAAAHAGERTGDVRAPCPLCAKGARDNAVCVTIKNDGSTVAHCHRCGESGAAPSPRHLNGHKQPAARMRPARPPQDHVALWESGVEPGEAFEHPYLTRKQVGAHGIRVAGDLLLVPMRECGDELVGVQKISGDGTKLYTRGAKVKAAFHLIGKSNGRVIVAEGYATAASIHEVTGDAVAVAFNCGNLMPAGKALHSKLPETEFIIAADDDHATPGNPGITHATEAARAIGAKIAIPQWPDGVDRGDGSDFNDLRAACGDEAVQRAIANARAPDIAEHQPAVPSATAPDPASDVDGAELLDSVRTFIARFVVFPSAECLDAVTLWAAHAHMVQRFHTTPRLAALSPEPESGKTRLLEVLDLLTPSPMLIFSPSVAAIFRKLAQEQVTLLFDEVDTVFNLRGKDDQNEDLRALLNAGYRRGASIPRCVGPKHEVVDFKVFAAVALAGIGDLPDTIMTRSIVIPMQRRTATEHIEQFRLRMHEDEGHALRDRLALWAASVGPVAGNAWPSLPDGVVDRRAEAWEPLIAVADCAGSRWGERARVAAVADVAAYRGRETSLGIRLLADLQKIFGDRDAMSTDEILKTLNAMDDAPWGDIRGKPLDSRGLAVRLKKYKVKSKGLRLGDQTPKGYARADLWDVWMRYLKQPDERSHPIEAATSATNATNESEMTT